MEKLRHSGIALKTYKEAKKEIGKYECNGKIIDEDTTIVYEKFYEKIIETGSFANDHEIIILWLCTANVFCKCGEYHHISSNFEAKYQIMDILQDIENRYDTSAGYPEIEPEGSLVVHILEIAKVSKKVEDIKFWL